MEFLVKEYSGNFSDFCWDPDLLVKPKEVDLIPLPFDSPSNKNLVS